MKFSGGDLPKPKINIVSPPEMEFPPEWEAYINSIVDARVDARIAEITGSSGGDNNGYKDKNAGGIQEKFGRTLNMFKHLIELAEEDLKNADKQAGRETLSQKQPVGGNGTFNANEQNLKTEEIAKFDNSDKDYKNSRLKQNSKAPKAQQEPKDILLIDDVCLMLHLERSTVYAYCQQGKLAHSKPGKFLYFKKEDVLNFSNQGRRKSKKEIEENADERLERIGSKKGR